MQYRFDQIAFNSTAKKKPTDDDKEHYIGLEHLDSDCLSITRWGSDVAPTGEKLLMKKGDILFGKRRAYQRKVGIAPFDGIFSAHGMVLRPNEEVINKDFLPFFISSDQFMERAVRISVGGLSPTINWKDLREQEFELPSLDKQLVLADKLWAAYRLKESYKKLLVATDEMVKSQFIEMFGNPLSDVQKYGLKKLGECCELNPRRPRLNLEDSDMVSFVPMPSVSENGHLVDVADEEYGKVKKGFTYFENNDVLFAKITPCMENGKGTIAQDLTNGIGMGSTEFHVLRPINNISNAYWLLALTRMPIFRERASKNMSGTGGQKRVGAAFLENFLVGLPPIGEQQAFEAIYKQADKSKFVGFKSQFIEMFKNLPVNGVIKDLTVGNIASVKKSYSKEDIINYIDISSIDNTTKTIVETSEHLVTKAPSRAQQCVQKGDILVSTVRPINRNIAVIEEDTSHLVASTGFCILRPQEGYKEYLLSIVLSDTYTEKMCDKANGGLYPAVNNSDVLNYGIHIPDEDTAKKVSALYQQSDKSKLVGHCSMNAMNVEISKLINKKISII